MKHASLDDAYFYVCDQISDIFQHCPTLKQLASEVDHVTELGSRHGTSTIALMAGNPQRLVSYDIDREATKNSIENIEPLAPETMSFEARTGDSRKIDLEPTDLLFIDTYHSYTVLIAELRRHHTKVSKYIACHDTVSFARRGEDGSWPGIRDAVLDFMREQPQWSIYAEYRYNNGLTVLHKG